MDGHGNVLKSERVPLGGSAQPPPNPTRNGYTFVGWDKPSNAWKDITTNLTVVARWNHVTTYESDIMNTSNEFEAKVDLAGLRVIVPGTSILFFGKEHWSIFNLLCLLLGALAFVTFTVITQTRKKRIDEPTGYRLGYRRIEGNWIDAKGEVVDENKEGKLFYRRGALIVSAVSVTIMLALSITTQDITWTLALFDRWSPCFVMGFIVALIAAIHSYKRVQVADETDLETESQIA